MDKRREELMKLKSYTEEMDNELTMILQTFQWDRKQLLQNPVLVTCRYDSNHKVPPDKREEHEKECYLRQNGYSKDSELLPDPFDSESNTLVKLSKGDIEQILANAARSDPLLEKGVGCRGPEPLSLERLQASYSADERRVIYDAVVSAVPSCHDLADLALLSGTDEKSANVVKSRQEILLELRNMRRRRTKYRVGTKSRNYSDVLRDVIRTQMEHYNEGKGETDATPVDTDNHQRDNDRRNSKPVFKGDGKFVPQPIKMKTEREDSTERNRVYNRERQDRTYRHGMESRDRRDIDNGRRRRDDRSRERRPDNYERSRERRPDNYESSRERRHDTYERSEKEGEYSRKRRYDDETRERRNYYDETRDRRKDNDTDKHGTEKRARRSPRHNDYDPDQVKEEPRLDDESTDHGRTTSRERRREENSHKDYKHKHKKDRYRVRERSREGRRDDRHDERPSERLHIKQERENSVASEDLITSNFEKEKADRSRKSKSSKHGKKSHRDNDYDSEYQVRNEPELDDEPNDHHRATSRDRSREETRHKDYKRKHKKDRRRDKERSREERRDVGYEERPNESLHIKQEGGNSTSEDAVSIYAKEKTSRSRKNKQSKHGNSQKDGHSSEIKQENDNGYYGRPFEDTYDPYKNIKMEK